MLDREQSSWWSARRAWYLRSAVTAASTPSSASGTLPASLAKSCIAGCGGNALGKRSPIRSTYAEGKRNCSIAAGAGSKEGRIMLHNAASVGSGSGAGDRDLVSTSCHLEPNMRFALRRFTNSLRQAAFEV